MAFSSSQLAAMVKEAFGDTFLRTFERNLAFSRLVLGRVTQSTVEKDITWKLQIAGTPGAGSYDENGSLGIYRNDLGPVYETARMSWKLNKVPVRVTGLAQAISRSPNSIIDVVAENSADATAELQRNMNLQLLGDGFGNINGPDSRLKSTGSDITGILAALDDGSQVPVYAGINRAIAPWWRSFVIGNGGVAQPLTENLMHQVLEELVQVREASVSDVWTSLAIHRQAGLLLGQDRQYQFSGSETPNYNGGFREIGFSGGGVDVKIVGVPLYQTGRMDFLNVDDLKYHVLADVQTEARDAGDSDSTLLLMKVYSELVHRNPWMTASLRDIAA